MARSIPPTNKERTKGMNISRRQFLIGGAAFASLGAFAGNRFILAAAGFKAGGKPRLKFGVLSDIHILRIGAEEKRMILRDNALRILRATGNGGKIGNRRRKQPYVQARARMVQKSGRRRSRHCGRHGGQGA